MSDTWKTLLQTLLVPIAIALVGYMINNTLQKKQMSLDKLKSTEQLIDDAFNDSNPDKAFALIKLLPQLTDDRAFGDTLILIINNYYTKKAIAAAQSGNDSAYQKISDAAKAFQGSGVSITDSLKANPLTSKAESARSDERKGLSFLQLGELDSAQKHFESADKKYPGFHSNYEISNILKAKIQSARSPEEKKVIQQETIDTIRKKFAWKMNVLAR
jgi:tetratricopeptide (TPR) repeat protein